MKTILKLTLTNNMITIKSSVKIWFQIQTPVKLNKKSQMKPYKEYKKITINKINSLMINK
jgi:hypothetical protein